MNRTRDDDILRDGERRRVPMTAMDSVQRAVFLTRQKLLADDAGVEVSDAWGRSGAALRRPGYRCLTGDAAVTAQQEVARARAEYLDTLTNAWRSKDQRSKPPKDEDDEDDDENEFEQDTAGNQEGAKARKRKAQYRDPQGRESGTEEVEEEDSLHRAQERRRRATDKAYADYEADLVAAHRSWK